jgi:NAD(P)-dependent dehydrogenase (short-subunit alcohol dehydrogenase family)
MAIQQPAPKIALVTGASSGIGRVLALQLAAAGYSVACVARRHEALAQVLHEIAVNGGQAIAIVADLTQPVDVLAAVGAAHHWHGRLDLVVACAGVYYRGLATGLSAERMGDCLEDNFWSAFRTAAASLPHLVASQGQIWFMNSFDAKKGLPMDSAYVAAKCALAGYAACLRQSMRGTGVHVGSVFPGRVDTPMLRGFRSPWASPKIPAERVARATLRGIRLRRAEVVVPWWCQPLGWVETISPAAADWLVRALRLDGTVSEA